VVISVQLDVQRVSMHLLVGQAGLAAHSGGSLTGTPIQSLGQAMQVFSLHAAVSR
jgi:hypothetical protein